MALNQLTDLQPTNIKVTGIATFDQTVGIAGTLTYQDVTNVDAVGILTARSDIDCNGDLDVDGHTNLDHVSIVGIVTISAGVNNEGLRITGQNNNAVIFTSPSINGSAGYRLNHHPATNVLRVDTTDQNGTYTSTVASFSSNGLDMADNIKLRLGTSQDLTLYHYSNDAYVDNATGSILFRQGGSEKFRIASNGDVTASHSGLAVNIFESTDNHSRFRIKSADASQSQLEFADQSDADAGEIRYDHANDKMTFHVGNNTERVGIDSSGNVTKPSNAIFHAFDAPSDISTNTDIVFSQERFDVGGGYNTSTGEYTAPATGYYHFYAQVYRQRAHDDSAWGFFVDTGSGYSQISEARMENDHNGDTGRGYATLQSSIYWYMTAGHKMKCRVTTPGNIHCNTAYSYFCGNLVG